MPQSFCSACGHPFGVGSEYCEACGAAVKHGSVVTHETVPVGNQPAPGLLLGIGHFFASQAYLSLITLLVFSGLLVALAPVGLGYLRMQGRTGDVVGQATTRSLGTGDLGARNVNTFERCSPIEVYFTDKALMSQVAALLESLDAVIAYGPTENGSFEIFVAPDKAPAVAAALNKAGDVVLKASTRQRCLAK